VALHIALGQRVGLTKVQIDGLAIHADNPAEYSELEHLVIRYAEQLTTGATTDEELDAQLKKHKERIKSRHKPKTSDTMAEAVAPVAPSFAVSRQPVYPMTPEQASAEFDGSDRVFLVYLDKDTDQVHVLYRREDESLGIIQPIRKLKR